MAIDRGLAKLLMREGNRRAFAGSVITAGRQDIHATPVSLKQWARDMGFRLNSQCEMAISEKAARKKMGHISDVAFLQALGFSLVDSIDINDYDHCTVVHDLNEDVPDRLHEKYDVLLDLGTSEHVFDFPRVLKNYFKMLKVGGRIIHVLPATDFVDHGFYMFSPTLFVDYYTANNWNKIDLLLLKYPNKHGGVWKVYQYLNYRPGLLREGDLSGPWLNYIVAEKTPQATCNAPVQQGLYSKVWDGTAFRSNSSFQRMKTIIAALMREFLPYPVQTIPRRIIGTGPSQLKLVAKY